MKKILSILVVLALVAGLVSLTACGKKEEEQPPEKKLKVVLYINGTLGDKSFFDSANRGIQRAIKELGIEGKVIEGGYDPARWEPDLEQLSEGDWDIIIVGTWQMTENLEKIAPKHPDKRYFIFDTTVDYSKGNLDNVYSILYKQNEGSFLVGALAAMITTSDMPLANPDKTIGFLGGMDIPVINDFKVGYIQGAHYIDPDIKVLVSYAGSFSDPAKGKELVLAQYDQGADISFNVAGETGLGLLDAAKEKLFARTAAIRDSAMKESKGLMEKAREEALSQVESTKERVRHDSEIVRKELVANVDTLARSIASKILDRKI